jgi:hypothetical protein
MRAEKSLTGKNGLKQWSDKKEPTMAKVPAYHTNEAEYPPSHRNVYHDHDDCKYGKTIKVAHRVSGTGGKPRCDECNKLG